MRKARSIALLVLAAATFSGPAFGLGENGEKGEVKVVHPDQVYHGDVKKFKSAAVVESEEVVRATSYYKEIVREGLDKNSAKYWVLIRKANEAFRKAVRKAAREEGYDLVAEVGALKKEGGGTLPDLTEAATRIVESTELGVNGAPSPGVSRRAE